MKLRELYLLDPINELLEGKEEFLADRDGEKLLKANQEKKDKPFDDALSLVQYLSSFVGPKYLQWVSRVYIKDKFFKVEDLPDLSQTLTAYEGLKRLNAINPNIDSFKTVGDLNTEVSKYSKDSSDKSDIFRYKQAMREMAENGEAEMYEKDNVTFYFPYSWEACKALRLANPDDMKLCVTYLDDESYYEGYSENGELCFFIADQTLYLFYFNTTGQKDDEDEDNDIEYDDEFSDASNNHLEPETIYKKHPIVKKEFYRRARATPTELLTTFRDEITDEKALELIKSNYYLAKFVDAKDEDFAKRVIEQDPRTVATIPHLPEHLRLYGLKLNPGIAAHIKPTAQELETIMDQIVKDPGIIPWSWNEIHRIFTKDQVHRIVYAHPEYLRLFHGKQLSPELIRWAAAKIAHDNPHAYSISSKLRDMENPTEQDRLHSLRLYPNQIQWIENPTPAMVDTVLSVDPTRINDIRLNNDTIKVALAHNLGFDRIPRDADDATIKYAIDQALNANMDLSFLNHHRLSPAIQNYMNKVTQQSF